MDILELERGYPIVNMMRIKRAVGMSGKWQDEEYVFTYIAGGSAEFVVKGRKYILNPGDMIVLPPHSPHVIVSQGTEPLIQYIFHFQFYGWDKFGMDCDEDIFASSVDGNEKLMVTSQYLRMYKEFSEKKKGWNMMLTGLAVVILTTYCRNYNKTEQSSDKPNKTKSWIHIENAIEYIHLNYKSDQLDNETISKSIGVTANYLTKLFQDYLGFSLHTYVLNLKIEKSKKILADSQINITEAAIASGFSSIHVFSKSFKNITGMTPSEYLENVVDKHKFTSTKDSAIGTNEEGIFYKG